MSIVAVFGIARSADLVNYEAPIDEVELEELLMVPFIIDSLLSACIVLLRLDDRSEAWASTAIAGGANRTSACLEALELLSELLSPLCFSSKSTIIARIWRFFSIKFDFMLFPF